MAQRFPHIWLICGGRGGAYLEIGGDRAAADVDELRHVVVGVEGPDAALEVEVLVELDALGLPDAGVELVGAVVARPQGDAVVGHVIQEPGLCRGDVVKVCIRIKNK